MKFKPSEKWICAGFFLILLLTTDSRKPHRLNPVSDQYFIAVYQPAVQPANLHQPPTTNFFGARLVMDFSNEKCMGSVSFIPLLILNLWSGIIMLFCIVGSFFGIMGYRYQQRAQTRMKHSEKETLKAEQKLKATELEMRSLRSQMNPHFLFNALSLINRYILQNNNLQAAEYLNKFSRHLRLVLQNSERTLVSLEDELETIKLYIELESLRFENRFEYKITVPEELQVARMKVPPLLIQPFVENAIWHGLMQKEESGFLDIELSIEQNSLFFRISDNGVGRKAAEGLASKSAVKNKLLGLSISEDRMALLNSSRDNEMNIKINDLHDANGVAAGTEVIIKIPLIYD